MLTLLGHPISTCTQRILSVLYELGLEVGVDFELQVIDFAKAEHKSPEFVKLQPFGKVPVLKDGDLTIFESRTIIRYLAKKFVDKKNLIGEDAKEVAVIDNWVEADGQEYNPPVSTIVAEKVFKLWRGLKTDEAVVEAKLATLNAVLDAYEAVLSDGRTWIAGERLSIADFSYIPYTWLLIEKVGIREPYESRPHVKAWWNRISTLESWKKVQAAPAE